MAICVKISLTQECNCWAKNIICHHVSDCPDIAMFFHPFELFLIISWIVLKLVVLTILKSLKNAKK